MQSTFDAIVQAHRVVREATDAILQAQEREGALAALGQLADILPEHFAWEERPGGYFEHIERTWTDGRRLVQALRSEHQSLLRDLEDLSARPPEDTAFLDDARTFSRRLRAHERKEARLGAEPGP